MNWAFARMLAGRMCIVLIAMSFARCAGPKNILYRFSPPLNAHSDWTDRTGQPHTGDSLDLEGIGLAWKIDAQSLGFSHVNESPDTLDIDWERCVYIDQAGRGHKGMVLGYDPFAGLPPIPPPTIVLPDSSIERYMRPQDHIRKVSSRGVDYWVPYALFQVAAYKGELERAQEYVGDTIGVVLAVNRRGRFEGWHFEFEILSAELEAKK